MPKRNQRSFEVTATYLRLLNGETMSRQSFRSAGNTRLESLEGTLLNTQASDAHLAAIAHTREWLNKVTS